MSLRLLLTALFLFSLGCGSKGSNPAPPKHLKRALRHLCEMHKSLLACDRTGTCSRLGSMDAPDAYGEAPPKEGLTVKLSKKLMALIDEDKARARATLTAHGCQLANGPQANWWIQLPLYLQDQRFTECILAMWAAPAPEQYNVLRACAGKHGVT